MILRDSNRLSATIHLDDISRKSKLDIVRKDRQQTTISLPAIACWVLGSPCKAKIEGLAMSVETQPRRGTQAANIFTSGLCLQWVRNHNFQSSLTSQEKPEARN